MIRLNLGCGRHPLPGWVNVDRAALPGVDLIADLASKAALPFSDDSVAEFHASHVLEHIREPLPLLQELHRIAEPGALLVLRMPYGSSDMAWEDPTHQRPYFLQSFGFFSQPYYFKADYGYRGDWQPERITLRVPEEQFRGRTAQEMLDEVRRYRNVVLEMIARLRAVKPIRPPERTLIVAPEVEFVLVGRSSG